MSHSERPTPLKAKSQGEGTGPALVRPEAGGLENDLNLRAFLREKRSLAKKHENCLVAYSGGSRVALGHSAQDLMDQIPQEFQDRPLFIKSLSSEPVQLRRPRRVLPD